MSSQNEQIRILNAGQPPSLVDRLAAAEAELAALSDQCRKAYRAYSELDQHQSAKANEVRELRLQLREEAARGQEQNR